MTTRTALRELCAADLMQRNLITVNVADSMREVERVLVDAQVSSVPVLDEAGTVLGVVSMRDVVTRYADDDTPTDETAADDCDWRAADGPCAGDLMTTEMLCVSPATPLAAMARLMVDSASHRVLVVKAGRLVGLVSSMDMLRAIAELSDQDGVRRSFDRFSRSFTPSAPSTSVSPAPAKACNRRS